MLNSFEEMPDESRLWIYQADRPFAEAELSQLEKITGGFVETWAAHGKALKAAYRIVHHQFIILAVDESYHPASGCSIDDSVGLIREIEQEFRVQLLDRTQVAFLINDKVQTFPLQEVKSKVHSGEIDDNTSVFNNFVQNLKDYKTSWILPTRESWVSRYLPDPQV